MDTDAGMGRLRRIAHNVGWLVGGKAVGGLLSLVYLALVARALGIEGFGTFALIFTYGQAVINIVQFQSWQLVIRMGAIHLAANRVDRLARLIRFSALIDLVSAFASAAIGYAAAGMAGHILGWSDDETHLAGLFGLSLIVVLRATPTGILRLLDRFDLLTTAELITPAVRFVGAAIVAFWMPGIGAFLAVWVLSDLLTSIILWQLAARALAERKIVPSGGWPRGVMGENPGLWRFAWTSNAGASINLVWQQLGTLAIGATAGAGSAGGRKRFRL